MDKKIIFRIFKDKLFKFIVICTSGLVLIPLVFIILYIIKNGISVINLEFLFTLPKPIGEAGGGIIHSLTGTFILIILASLFSIPLGIGAGIYAVEHKKSKVAKIIIFSVEILQGIPSIVIGIIGYMWLVKPIGQFSALSGGITLGIMMLPIVIKATEETLKLIPFSLKEAAIALGVPYYKAILKVILPSAKSGIITGILVGIARISGETAPLLFTAFGNNFLNFNIFKPIDALPLLIFNYATSPYKEWHKIAWGASFVIVILILVLNISTRLVVKKWRT